MTATAGDRGLVTEDGRQRKGSGFRVRGSGFCNGNGHGYPRWRFGLVNGDNAIVCCVVDGDPGLVPARYPNKEVLETGV